MVSPVSEGAAPALERDEGNPLAWVVCAQCRADFLPRDGGRSTPFFITSCSHTICADCLGHAHVPAAIVPCPRCGLRCRTLLLDTGSTEMTSIKHCFRSPRELADELAAAVEFQRANLVEQLDFFKDKVKSQRQVLKKLATELSALQRNKAQARWLLDGVELECLIAFHPCRKREDLERENALLRAQLARLGVGEGPPPAQQQGAEQESRKKRRSSGVLDDSFQPSNGRPDTRDSFRPATGTSTAVQPKRLSLPPESVSAQNDKRLHAKVQQGADQPFAETSNGSIAQTWVDLPGLRQYRDAAPTSSNSDGRVYSRSNEAYLENGTQSEETYRPPSRPFPAHFEQQLPSFSNNLYERQHPQNQLHSQPLQRATFEQFAAPRAGPTPFNAGPGPSYEPPPTPNRQPFRPAGGTPRPLLQSFAYQDPMRGRTEEIWRQNSSRAEGRSGNTWQGPMNTLPSGRSSRAQFR